MAPLALEQVFTAKKVMQVTSFMRAIQLFILNRVPIFHIIMITANCWFKFKDLCSCHLETRRQYEEWWYFFTRRNVRIFRSLLSPSSWSFVVIFFFWQRKGNDVTESQTLNNKNVWIFFMTLHLLVFFYYLCLEYFLHNVFCVLFLSRVSFWKRVKEKWHQTHNKKV